MLTNIFGIELVNANQHTDSSSPQNPGESWAEFRELAWMYVVHQEVVKLVSSNGPPGERRNRECGVVFNGEKKSGFR